MHGVDGAAGGAVIGRGALRVDATFDGMGALCGHDLVLCVGKLDARSHAKLPLDQVDIGYKLGDGMLDLQARIHLHEVEIAVVCV